MFPRGLLPPTLQLGGTAPDAMLVHVTFPGMDYQGYFGASSPSLGGGSATFSTAAWRALTQASAGQVQATVAVTKTTGGAVSGPVTETWTFAPGSLRGTIYYETYDSQIAGGVGSVGIMRIKPGLSQPTVVRSGCGNVCHTASANGSTLVAATSLTASASYDLTNGAALIEQLSTGVFTYGALYPDGNLAMSATHYRTWTSSPSRLYDTHTGTIQAAPGWDSVITNAGTASFSPDGKHIAFNHEDTAQGHTLAVMDFVVSSRTFSNLRDVATDSTSTLAWPAFTPDSSWVVYQVGSNAQFETDNGATGDLFVVDLATKTVHRLDSLDGYVGTGTQTYLPAADPGLSFAPTVLPVAVGGYFWVVFTSHRSYGNTLPSKQPSSGGTADEYGKLWVAALDVSPTAGKDPSHPAFFLDGQELQADNLRGFWVQSPCGGDGSACEYGDDCCTGYCRAGEGGALACVQRPAGCSNEYEACTTAADCCVATDQCIDGYCALAAP